MGGEFSEVYHHRMRYFLTPQFDMYRHIRERIAADTPGNLIVDEALAVLDYGCGNGVGCIMLKHDGWQIVGIDSDEEAIAFARDSWGHLAEFKHQDWAAPADEASDEHRYRRQYDIVVSLEVIEHVDNPVALLQALRDSCRNGARVFVSTLNHNSQYRKNRGHVGKFCVEDFRVLCAKVFPGVRIFNYDFSEELDDESTLTPMVAVWKEGAE